MKKTLVVLIIISIFLIGCNNTCKYSYYKISSYKGEKMDAVIQNAMNKLDSKKKFEVMAMIGCPDERECSNVNSIYWGNLKEESWNENKTINRLQGAYIYSTDINKGYYFDNKNMYAYEYIQCLEN